VSEMRVSSGHWPWQPKPGRIALGRSRNARTVAAGATLWELISKKSKRKSHFREEALCEVQIALADRKYGGTWKVVANLGTKEAAGREAYP
jgi:hypothetical protein